MQIFIVIYIFGKMAAALGPFPTDMETCQTRLIPQLVEKHAKDWAETVASGRAERLKPYGGKVFHGPSDTAYKCEAHDAGAA